MTARPSDRMRALGIDLPSAPAPAAAYLPYVVDGGLVFTAGQIAVVGGELLHTGRVGAEVDVEAAAACARQCTINVLAQLSAAADHHRAGQILPGQQGAGSRNPDSPGLQSEPRDLPGDESFSGVDAVARILKLTVFVASAPDFTDQHVVANAASELLVDVFGDEGRHARSAVGVAALPMSSPVEVEAIARLRDR